MSDRRGLSLVELLVVAVLGSLILASLYGVLTTNQRTQTVSGARMQNQQTVRAGMEILFSELREISPGGGDLLMMGADSLTIRVMRSAGILCDTVPLAESGFGSNPSWKVVHLGDTFRTNDSVWLFAEGDSITADDDRWFAGEVEVLDLATCQGRPARELRFTGPTIFVTDTPTVGTLARSFLTYTYGIGVFRGEPYLVRAEPGGASAPLVGPLRSGSGLSFTYLDRFGNVTGVPSEVRQVVVVLRTQHPVRDPAGNQITDSLTTRIFTRN